MFTGLVQGIGTVTNLAEHESSIEVELEIGTLIKEVTVGDSISVNGTCLTVTKLDSDRVSLDVMKQTLKLTNLHHLRVGDPANLELAVLPTQRLGGHLVQGHVDGIGSVIEREPGDRWERFLLSIPAELMKYVVAQGSITVNGVSLTVGSIDDENSHVELWIIPETSLKTTFGTLKVGDQVNIEVDVLGKYVERLLSKGAQS
ncbi:MAG TPA: riboflavin synthase [Candidatus Nanopelagicaceae bacterium]